MSTVLAADAFLGSGSTIPGRVADVGGTWTARPTSPLNRAGGTIAQVTSAMVVQDDRLYSGLSDTYCTMATLDAGTPDIDAILSIEDFGDPSSGCGMVLRWTATAWLLALLAQDNLGGYHVQLIRETVAPNVRTDLVAASVGAPGVYPWIRVRASGTTLALYETTSSDYPTSWDLLGTAVDSTGVDSTHHGVAFYYSPLTYFGLDNFEVRDLEQGGWSAGVVRRA